MKKKYPKDLTGLRFNRLLVLSIDETNNTKNSRWLCLCDCGKKTYVNRPHLLQGHTRSCGCFKIEMLISRVKTHGKRKSRVYWTWSSMRARCNNPKAQSYPNYGGRGITICNRWSLFENFYKDMGDPPVGFSIERIDNSKGYSKENCKWATKEEQMNNMRNNRIIEYGDELLTLAQAAKKYKMDYFRLRSRLINGWSINDAIEKPKWATGAHSAKFITFNGVTKSMRQWSVPLGGSDTVVGHRIKMGWSVKDAILTPINKRIKNNE